ncbi:MAG: hypothetical protein HKL89_00100 [Candidatus Dormibacteraeota bacterium]|nr:hypothetical protein [Candidatus Dormibacteraeota bacterium]
MNAGEEMLPVTPTRAQQAAKARLVKELGEADFALPGSLVVESQRCGKPSCACHHDPPKLHGPYARWTRKIDNKTVTRLLTDEEVAQYRPLFENAKRLRRLLADLQQLTMEMVDAPSTPPRHRSQADRT